MSIVVKCPGCAKRYALADQLAGKKARCKACGGTLVVPPPSSPAVAWPAVEEPNIPALVTMEGAAPVDESGPIRIMPPAFPTERIRPVVTVPPTMAIRRSRASDSSYQGWSDGQNFTFKTGMAISAMGVVALILPLFGLQFRVIAESGNSESAVAVGLVIFGGVICFLASLGRVGTWIVRGVLWSVAGVVLLGVISILLMAWHPWTGSATSSPPLVFNKPASPTQTHPAPRMPSPQFLARPDQTGFLMPVPIEFAAQYPKMCAEYGEANVVRISVTGADFTTLTKRFPPKWLTDAKTSLGAQKCCSQVRGNHLEILFALLADLDAPVRQLFPNESATIDRKRGIIEVDLQQN